MKSAGGVEEKGILRPELFLGVVTAVSAAQARVSLQHATAPSASHFELHRYGRGEVGEVVLIEGQQDLVLARVTDVKVADGDGDAFSRQRTPRDRDVDVFGYVQFLGTVRTDTLAVSPGVASYPRLGDRCYAAPHWFIADIPKRMERAGASDAPVVLRLGAVGPTGESEVVVRPERLFGRHCAILGATGGGKSWTVAGLVAEAARHRSKVLLVDATGEYRSLGGEGVSHAHLGEPLTRAEGSRPVHVPPSTFNESDFFAIFEPSSRIQAPRLQDAIRTLRLVKLDPSIANGFNGRQVVVKARHSRVAYDAAMAKHADAVEDPATPFDIGNLAGQLLRECVWPTPPDDNERGSWGKQNESDYGFCVSLATRIEARRKSRSFKPIFGEPEEHSLPLADLLDEFLTGQDQRVLRLCLGGVSYEHHVREFIVNAIGRLLLERGRGSYFASAPLVVFLDEAHNFLGHSVGSEESAISLDAFEMIAREGRKYGVNICVATQRPRDLTEGVLSQMGTLIVHRLTNHHDREIVERACGEIDRSATAFLSNLRQGEAVIVGVDFPIPMTITVRRPPHPPESDGPSYQRDWKL